MPRVPLHTKIKAAWLGYLQSANPLGGDLRTVLAGFHFYRGGRGGFLQFPALYVTVPRSVSAVPIAPVERGRKSLVEITIETAALPGADKTFNTAADAHDLIVETVKDAMLPELIRPFVNVGGLSRPVAAFFLGNFLHPEIETAFQSYTAERHSFLSILTYKDVYAMGSDGDGT